MAAKCAARIAFCCVSHCSPRQPAPAASASRPAPRRASTACGPWDGIRRPQRTFCDQNRARARPLCGQTPRTPAAFAVNTVRPLSLRALSSRQNCAPSPLWRSERLRTLCKCAPDGGRAAGVLCVPGRGGGRAGPPTLRTTPPRLQPSSINESSLTECDYSRLAYLSGRGGELVRVGPCERTVRPAYR